MFFGTFENTWLMGNPSPNLQTTSRLLRGQFGFRVSIYVHGKGIKEEGKKKDVHGIHKAGFRRGINVHQIRDRT